MKVLSKEKINELIDEFELIPKDKKLVLFGAGQIGKEAINWLIENDIRIEAIADNDSSLWAQKIRGIEIISPEKICDIEPFMIILTSNYYNEMAKQLLDYGLNNYISYFLFRGKYKFEQGTEKEQSAVSRALNWIKDNQQKNGGISVYKGCMYEYPEVSGYIVPTLLNYGYREEALLIIKWLSLIINDDGTFNAAGSKRSYLFDTAQALRGFNAISKVTNRYYGLQRKIANKLFDVLSENDGYFPKSYEDDEIIPESIMLFALVPMLNYAETIGDEDKVSIIHKSIIKYLQEKRTLSLNTLTHFLSYEIDGLIDLGYKEEVVVILEKLVQLQSEDGSIPAFKGVDWVCTTGCAQIAICLYKLGNYKPANRLMDWLEKNMELSGGFCGSVGDGAGYYQDREISWAVKFYLDSYKLMIKSHFDHEFSLIAPNEIDVDDAQLAEVISQITDGQNVLEVGCGKGRILKRIKEKMPNCVLYGVDISDEMISFVSKDIHVAQGNIEFLPYCDNLFDVVYTVECLEHSPNFDGAVSELIRVCKQEGKIIIIDKQKSEWGRFATPPWEQWPDKKELEDILNKKCINVDSHVIRQKGMDERDDLFVAWSGTKRKVHSKHKKLVFFGAGLTGRSAAFYADRSGMDIALVVDNNSEIWGSSFCGIPVDSPEKIFSNKDEYTTIITVGYEYYKEVREQLIENGMSENSDFFNFHDVFLQGTSAFGESSGVLDLAEDYTLVKTSAKNKLLINNSSKDVIRLIRVGLEEQFEEIYKRCNSNNLFDKYIVKTKNSNEHTTVEYPLNFKHEYITLFTYAVEWSPKMFYDYTLFMINFLHDLDKAGLGWLDGHAFNATFSKSGFAFFDFDAICLGKTPYFYIQEFINNHIVILHMMCKNLVEKAYLYLGNPYLSLSIKDIQGYLSKNSIECFEKMNSECHEYAISGDFQKCANVLKEYVLKMEFDQILRSGWNGYQNELYEREDQSMWSNKQKAVVEMIRLVSPKTMIDLAGNMGWYGLELSDEIERCIIADIDYSCIDFVYKNVVNEKVDNVYPVFLNLVTPTPAYYKDYKIGDTAIIPWRKSAIERFKSEVVLALAIIHHLIFSQQLSFDEVIGQLSLYSTKWLIVEFIERYDSVVEPALENRDFDWYTKDGFEASLLKEFEIVRVENSEPSRVLYLCKRKGNE